MLVYIAVSREGSSGAELIVGAWPDDVMVGVEDADNDDVIVGVVDVSSSHTTACSVGVRL